MDKSRLISIIRQGDKLYREAVQGLGEDEYYPDHCGALHDAVAAAMEVYEAEDLTEEAAEAAANRLYTVVENFKPNGFPVKTEYISYTNGRGQTVTDLNETDQLVVSAGAYGDVNAQSTEPVALAAVLCRKDENFAVAGSNLETVDRLGEKVLSAVLDLTPFADREELFVKVMLWKDFETLYPWMIPAAVHFDGQADLLADGDADGGPDGDGTENPAAAPMQAVQTNIIGTATMMDACRKYGIQRYHQVSTDEVYGDLPLDRPDLFFTEETPIHTSSPYSSSKAAADLLVQAYHRTYGLPVTISRCSNNYGPYHFPEKLIPLMIANALNDKPLPVYGEGLNVRDWLYVEDHCRAIDLIIHKGRVGEVYNVGGHNEMRNIDIVKLICKELGKPESLIVHVADRKGHDMRYAIDPTKIHNELGWLPETKFADGIKKTIDWYLNHREWWETIISGEYQDYYEKMYGNR